MKFITTLILSTVFFVSCGEQKEVVWPALNELDEVSVLVEHAAKRHEHGKQGELLLQAQTLISEVASTLPENVKSEERVTLLLTDLEALGGEIDKMDSLGHDELDDLANSIHPIVAQLMKSSGVPHVHADHSETEDHSGHDHGDHDHGHDDHDH